MTSTLQPDVSSTVANVQQLVLDSEGRITLPQPIQDLLGIAPGAKLSYLLADGVLVLLPKGLNILSLVARASEAAPQTDPWYFDHEAMEKELAEIRHRVVREIYGDAFWDELERKYGHLVGTALAPESSTNDGE